MPTPNRANSQMKAGLPVELAMTPPMARSRAKMPPKRAAVLSPLKWLCMSASTLPRVLAFPVTSRRTRSAEQAEQQLRHHAGRHERESGQHEGGERGARDAADDRPGWTLLGVAQQHGEPAQVDRHTDHRVEDGDGGQRPLSLPD